MDEVSDTEGVSFVSKVPAGQVVVPELQLPEQDSRSDAVVGGLEAQVQACVVDVCRTETDGVLECTLKQSLCTCSQPP